MDKPKTKKGTKINLVINGFQKIVCTRAYTFEGKHFCLGQIEDHCKGRLIPEDWRLATEDDIRKYYEKIGI